MTGRRELSADQIQWTPFSPLATQMTPADARPPTFPDTDDFAEAVGIAERGINAAERLRAAYYVAVGALADVTRQRNRLRDETLRLREQIRTERQQESANT